MKFLLKEKSNAWATFQPVLVELLKLIDEGSAILELGCGQCSTELIHEFGNKKDFNILSVDSELQWVDEYRNTIGDGNGKHLYLHTRFESFIGEIIKIREYWTVVFIDQGDWKNRADCLLYFKDHADYVVLHDSDPYPGQWFGKTIESMIPGEKGAVNDYSDVFKYYEEFWPDLPWASPTGPATLVGSNKHPIKIKPNWFAEEVEI